MMNIMKNYIKFQIWVMNAEIATSINKSQSTIFYVTYLINSKY